MDSGLYLVPKKTRECTSKVRTGCRTCKARHVKCDEVMPICRRCVLGGRICEYSTTGVAPRPRNMVTIYLPPVQNQPVLLINDHGLDFFYRNLATNLDGQFESNFWSKLVLQLSHSEPSIRHAISAISIIYRGVESSLCYPPGYISVNSEAQIEWNKAMKSLSARIHTHPNSSLVPLVCCLLFTCIGFLRGNEECSMLHVENGFKILVDVDRNKSHNSSLGSTALSHDVQVIKDHVAPMFLRLNVICSLAGRMTPPIYNTLAQEGPVQEDLADSRRRLLKISDTCIRYIHEVSPRTSTFQISIDDLAEQVRLQAMLDVWYVQLDELVERLRAAGSPVKWDALNLLLIQYKVIYIWMRVCTTAGETATDFYHTDFEEVVHYAEQITESNVSMASPQPLSFDIQLVGPLYYTALKCRHPVTRRRALKMLQSAPRREGLWNAHFAYVTAKRVIELEERPFGGREAPDETSRVYGLPLPDDESRFCTLHRTHCDLWTDDHNIVSNPTCSGMLEAKFRLKPRGILGEWQTITEYIEL